jgi:hypothetical protein
MAPALTNEPAPPWLRKTGLVLLVIWAVLFVLGATGELFGIEFLREITDLKRIFLR